MSRLTGLVKICLGLALIWPGVNHGQSIYRTDYKRSSLISDPAGKPKTSQTWYFPAERFIDSSEVLTRVPKSQINRSMRTNPRYLFVFDSAVFERKLKVRIDTFRLKWFSYDLYTLQEPVLYNYPLAAELYRLTWLRSFQPPVVVVMEKKGETIRLRTKMLRKIPELPGHTYQNQKGDIHVADTSASIPFQLNTVKRISKADYNRFIALLDSLSALQLSPLGLRKSMGSDGSEWILEIHRPEGYYFLTRWSPRDGQPLRILGDFLLNLGATKNENRY